MLKIYLLPAIIFQITIIAGGYGTGQEFVQFFLSHGPRTGLVGLILAGICWSLVCMFSFSCAVKWQSYNYHLFFKNLLGSKAFIFEITYIFLMLIVLAIVAASVGNLGEIMLGTNYNLNIILLLLAVSACVYLGSNFIERIFSYNSAAVIAIYVVFALLCFYKFGSQIAGNLNDPIDLSQSIQSGIAYAGYNLGLIPPVFFVLRYIQTKRQALIAGAIAGIWAVLPGIMFYLAMLGKYPAVLQENIPSLYMLSYLQMPLFEKIFSIILFITLMQTSISLIHSFSERIRDSFTKRELEFKQHYTLIISMILLLATVAMAQFGLKNLIKHGYGLLTWLIILVYVLPLFWRTLVLRRI